MERKYCSKCKETKSTSEFCRKSSRRDGLQGWCKKCMIIIQVEWRKNNRERYLSNKREWREKNKEIERTRSRKWRENNIEYEIERGRKWYKLNGKENRKNNKDRINGYSREWHREKRETDPSYKLRRDIGSQINNALKRAGGSKQGESIMQYLPYTIEELKEHLESLWLPGMTWDNHTHEGWHLDHIIPQSALLYDSMDHPNFRKCWALENLQPLWAKDNIRKSNKIL